MTLRRTPYLVLLAVTFAACGGSGGGGDNLGPEQPLFNGQAPSNNLGTAPGNTEAPVNNIPGSQPGTNPAAPPSDGQSGGGASLTCSQLCSIVESKGCDVDDDCAAECSQVLVDYQPCLSPLLNVYACLFADPSFQCTEQEDDLDDALGAFENCQGPLESLSSCLEANGLDDEITGGDDEPPPMGAGGTDGAGGGGGTGGTGTAGTGGTAPGAVCTIEGDGCVGCVETCDACLCVYEGDAASCTSFCGQ